MNMKGNDKKKQDTINILWTGGWDSTFRILQLSDKDVVIQPFYLKDNRQSEEFELNAIKSITNEILSLKSTLCQINDIITLNTSDIEEDKQITDAYNQILEKSFFGSQYDWLARFAKKINNLELTIHKDDKAFDIIKMYGNIIEISDDVKGNYFKIDTSTSSKELIRLFENFHFPILNYSKLEMKKTAEINGYLHIMNKTWFCYRPVDGQPCGECNPCIYTIEEGLRYRFSKQAIKRYYRNKTISILKKSFLYKIARKLLKTIKSN